MGFTASSICEIFNRSFRNNNNLFYQLPLFSEKHLYREIFEWTKICQTNSEKASCQQRIKTIGQLVAKTNGSSVFARSPNF